MNLKEAFRYQNRIQAHMDLAGEILSQKGNITRVENTHLRSRALPGARDETVLDAPGSEYADRITDMARFLVFLLGEKDKLFAAIRRAKEALPIDMDSETSLNMSRQTMARLFRSLADLTGSEQILSNGGTGYRFNAEGNQVSYRCDLRRVTTINFDRKVIRSLISRLHQASDAMSAQLDLCLVTSSVDYQPPFDVNASFQEAFETFLSRS